MPLLDSLLAFILIVFAVSMVVTVVVQIWLDAFRWRSKHLRILLSEYYKFGLVPAVRRRIGSDAYSLKKSQQNELEIYLCGSTVPTELNSGSASKLASNLVAIDRDQLKARLSASGVGKNVADLIRAHEQAKTPPTDAAVVAKEIDGFFEDLAVRFEVFGSRASESFRRHARAASIVFGVIIALALNIDGFRILRQVMDDPTMRAAITNTDREFVKDLEAIHKDLKGAEAIPTTIKNLRKTHDESLKQIVGLRDKVEANPAAAATLKSLNVMSASLEKLDEGAKTLEEALERFKGLSDVKKQQLDAAIKATSLAYDTRLTRQWAGWAHCNNSDEFHCSPLEKIKDLQNFSTWTWVLGCLFTGLLAGLGAPFWHDLIKSVAQARKTVRNPDSTLAKA